MGRPERALPCDDTPLTEFAGRLRAVRLSAGQPSYRRLAAVTHYSAATLARAAAGQALPSLEVTLAYVTACGGDAGQWRAAWDEVVARTKSRSGAAETAGTPAPEPAPARGGCLTAPRELPARIRHFTGRTDELTVLTRLLDQASEETSGAVVISAIGGTAGVGKTALAVHWAHGVAERFPDGQLYVNLRGYDPGQPMAATDALAGFLRALGMPGPDIPAETEERAARYRSLLAARRMLVVLDNAGSVEQVRPLLPGAPACMVVVTSRDPLAGLVARDGAQRLDLDLLSLAEAVSLLRALIGERAAADPAATAALATECCLLPLALRVAAELAIARPADPLADLVSELAEEHRRLDLLDAGGDPRTAVRAVFSWSCRQLDTEAARAFRLVATHPGQDFDCYAVAALTGTTAEHARGALERLTRAYLIRPVRPAWPGRYGMHDLLRAYARQLAETQDTEEERRLALTRLFDSYLHSAAKATNTLFPAERGHNPSVCPPDVLAAPPVADPVAARGWLDSERDNLVAVIAHAADHGWPRQATDVAITLIEYLRTGDHTPEAVIIYARVLRATRRMGDRAAEAHAQTILGTFTRSHQEAVGHFQQSLALSREIGDLARQAGALCNLALADTRQGHYQQSVGHYRESLSLYRALGDLHGEAAALGNLGVVERRLGHNREASVLCQQALILFQKTGYQAGEAEQWMRLGYIDTCQGSYRQAIDRLERALALYREIGYRTGQVHALAILGDAERHLGRNQRAIEHCREAVSLSREIGETHGEMLELNFLGQSLCADGRLEQARACHDQALVLASQDGDPHRKADSHSGLARSYLTVGDPGQARHHWQQALALYAGLGVPEADQVRAQLAALDAGTRAGVWRGRPGRELGADVPGVGVVQVLEEGERLLPGIAGL